MKNFKFLLTVMTVLMVFSAVSFAATPNEPVVGKIKGSKLYSTAISPVEVVYIDRNISGNTQFGSSAFRGRGDDIYNQGYKIYALEGCTNVSAGTLVDVTDFVSSTGTFTVETAGAAWAAGDRVLLVFGSLATDLEGGSSGGMVFTGLVTTASTTVPAVKDFIGLGDDRFNSAYFMEVTADIDGACTKEIRGITDFVSSTGVITLESALGSAVDVGDRVTVFHQSLIADRLPGRAFYSGRADTTSGSANQIATAGDSIYVSELVGFGNDYFNESDYFLHIANTIDGAAPLGEYQKILDYVSVTGCFVVSNTGDLSEFSAVIGDGDIVKVVHKDEVPTGGSVTRTTGVNGQTTGLSIFTCVGGPVWLTSLTGKVTTVIGSTTNNLKLQVFKGSTTTDISAVLDTNADAVGSIYNITGTFANATVVTAPDTPKKDQQAAKIYIPEGAVIKAHCAASTTGEIQWHATWESEGSAGFLKAN